MIFIWICFPLIDLHPDQLQRSLELFESVTVTYFYLVCSVWLAGSIHFYVLYTCVCMYPLGIHGRVTCWLYLGARSCSSLASVGLLKPLTGFVKITLNI